MVKISEKSIQFQSIISEYKVSATKYFLRLKLLYVRRVMLNTAML